MIQEAIQKELRNIQEDTVRRMNVISKTQEEWIGIQQCGWSKYFHQIDLRPQYRVVVECIVGKIVRYSREISFGYWIDHEAKVTWYLDRNGYYEVRSERLTNDFVKQVNEAIEATELAERVIT